MNQESRQKTAFASDAGLFELSVFPFRLCSAASVSQWLTGKSLETWLLCVLFRQSFSVKPLSNTCIHKFKAEVERAHFFLKFCIPAMRSARMVFTLIDQRLRRVTYHLFDQPVGYSKAVLEDVCTPGHQSLPWALGDRSSTAHSAYDCYSLIHNSSFGMPPPDSALHPCWSSLGTAGI